MVKVQELYNQGRVLETPKLGLAKAQAHMTHNYFRGSSGFEEDLEKGLE